MSYNYDHRLLADEMEIFFLNEQIGAGLPVWLPNGVAIRDELEFFIKKLEKLQGYQRVVSPHIAKDDLYQKSEHLRAFKENMYPPIQWENENNKYYLKPMNCPHHHKVFDNSLKSYRQLPFRIAEYGQVYRFENSGSLKGLSRVRGLCQNDAHIYLDPAQAEAELDRVIELHEECYKKLGLFGYNYRLSLHDPKRKNDFDGDSNLWLECENILRQCLIKKNLPFIEAIGEAAFYGPKIDIQMRLGQDNEESISSIQLDFNSAENFDLKFINQSGDSCRPWIIHRAPLGSHERFIAVLLEYFDGQLPGWLCPVQLYILPIGLEQQEKAFELAQILSELNIRVHVDINQGSLAKRIHFAHKLRPFAKLVLGPKEVSSHVYSLELREKVEILNQEGLVDFLVNQVKAP